jgi:quinolinate synthase
MSCPLFRQLPTTTSAALAFPFEPECRNEVIKCAMAVSSTARMMPWLAVEPPTGTAIVASTHTKRLIHLKLILNAGYTFFD